MQNKWRIHKKEGGKYMDGNKRRQLIIRELSLSSKPIAGSLLADKCQVSRQVIVQDIALLRASGYSLLSTSRGYLLQQTGKAVRVFKVSHTDEQMEDELTSIVDLGGTIKNVMVNHKVYGHMEAEMNIDSRYKISHFMEDIRSGKSSPLKNITSNYHYHTILAETEDTLDLIQNMLKSKEYLVEQ